MRRTKIRNDSPIQKNKKIIEEKTASQTPASTKWLISSTQNSRPISASQTPISVKKPISNTQNSLRE
jgi:hypothetical protein